VSAGKTPTPRSRAARSLSAVGSLAAAPLKPLREGATVAVLDSAWFESLLADALDSEQVQAALKKALETEGAEHVVETLFDSGLVDEFVERLVADEAIWALIDGVLASDGAEQLITDGALWSLIGKAVASDGAERLVNSSALWGLIDSTLTSDGARRLIESGALWELIGSVVQGEGAKSLVEGGVVWELIDRGLKSDGLQQLLSSGVAWQLAGRALDTDEAEQLISNPVLWGLIGKALQSPGAGELVNGDALWGLINRALASDGARELIARGALWTFVGNALRAPGAEELVTSDAFWRLVDKALASDGADRLIANLFDSGLADQFVDRLHTSEAVWHLVDEIAASPAVTSAVTQQSLGFADQFGNEICARSRKADDWLLETAHRHRKTRDAPPSVNGSRSQPGERDQPAAAVASPAIADRPARVKSDVRHVGIVSRTIAFGIDAGLISLVALVVELGVALIVSVGHLPAGLKSAMVAAGAVLFALWAMVYFVAFWCTTGQTPGARVMRFRVVPTNGDELKPRRAVVRTIGLVLAAIPLFAGYLPVAFARKRRGLHDYAARTNVVEAPRLSLAEQRRVAAPSQRSIEILASSSPQSDAVTVGGRARRPAGQNSLQLTRRDQNGRPGGHADASVR